MATLPVRLSDITGVAEARRVSSSLAVRMGFTEEQAGRVALVVSEAATNIVRHAGGGEVLIAAGRHDGAPAIEILALDKGPGIRDIQGSMRDGYSTTGTSGTGLGAIRRLSSMLDIYSMPGKGTALLARIAPSGSAAAPRHRARPCPVEYGGVSVPVRGETVCGDAWSVRTGRDGAEAVVVDGLGHGPLAAAAAREAIRVFEENASLDHSELMARMHGALRPTRGAALALLRLSFAEHSIRFIGVGNIAGSVIGDSSIRQMVSHPGTVGHEMRKIHQFTYDYPQFALILLHSDGVTGHFSMQQYPGLAEHDPALIAAVVYRDFNRPRDDATVVVLRQRREP